jgi:hypothetical protein
MRFSEFDAELFGEAVGGKGGGAKPKAKGAGGAPRKPTKGGAGAPRGAAGARGRDRSQAGGGSRREREGGRRSSSWDLSSIGDLVTTGINVGTQLAGAFAGPRAAAAPPAQEPPPQQQAAPQGDDGAAAPGAPLAAAAGPAASAPTPAAPYPSTAYAPPAGYPAPPYAPAPYAPPYAQAGPSPYAAGPAPFGWPPGFPGLPAFPGFPGFAGAVPALPGFPGAQGAPGAPAFAGGAVDQLAGVLRGLGALRPPAPAAAAPAMDATALLSTILSAPQLQQALRSAATLGPAAARSLQLPAPTPAGTQSVSVPLGAAMNAIMTLARQSMAEIDEQTQEDEAEVPEYLVGEDGEFVVDPGSPEARAARVAQLFQAARGVERARAGELMDRIGPGADDPDAWAREAGWTR